MKRRRYRNRTSIAGFTLIETLIATAMMVAVLGALATVTAQWLPNWNRGFARVQRSDLLALGLERIVADLAAAEFVRPNGQSKEPLFEGAELSVTFVRSALGPNSSRGLEIVRLAEIDRWAQFGVGPVALPFTPLPPEGSVGSHLQIPPTRWCWCAPRTGFRSPMPALIALWRSTWSDASRLPRAVRITRARRRDPTDAVDVDRHHDPCRCRGWNAWAPCPPANCNRLASK